MILCRGYMAPEYALHGQLTEKVDVFGFGVLVLEISVGVWLMKWSFSSKEYGSYHLMILKLNYSYFKIFIAL